MELGRTLTDGRKLNADGEAEELSEELKLIREEQQDAINESNNHRAPNE